MKENPIIVAMDGMSYDGMIVLARSLRGSGCVVKVNDALLERGASLVEDLMRCGLRVMVDGKWHDIPSTMRNLARRFLDRCPPWAVTVHASAGALAVDAVARVFQGTRTKVLATTVLTSFNVEMCREIYSDSLPGVVRKFASVAFHGGAHGFVCAPEEARLLRAAFPSSTIVTPGVRSPEALHNDQARVLSPAGALEEGANYIVIGRQIVGARDPLAEMRRVLREELALVAA